MWEKIKKACFVAPIIVFLGFIFGMMAMTYKGPVQKSVENTKFTFESYVELSDKFEDVLQKNIFKKYGFINLNGRLARILRINSLNGIQKLNNGFLTFFDEAVDMSNRARNVIELNDFLRKRGIYFLYILVPSKNSMYDVKFAPGYGDDSRKNLISMINTLKAEKVNNLDMDVWFRENNWHMKDVFFKTDHHLMPQAGLAIARCTMELLQRQGIAEYDKEKLQDKNYKVKILKNWFLGAQGKKVGKDYAGLDNIAVYYPKFKTNYSFAGLSGKTTNWTYSNSLLNEKYIKEKDLFGSDPHCIYLYGENPYQIISNISAVNRKKVLITGTSVRRVWQYFLATQFQDIYSTDFRAYTDGSFAQYIEEVQPDIVIMYVSPRSSTDDLYYNFGIQEYLADLEKTRNEEPILDLGNIELQAEDNNNNKFEVVCGGLEPNQTYTLTIDNTELLGVKKSFIQMALENFSTNEELHNRYFEPNSSKKQKWIFTTPENTEDTYGIYLYAGVRRHTAKIAVKVNGIRLQKGIFEN